MPIFDKEFLYHSERQRIAIKFSVNHYLKEDWTTEDFIRAVENKRKRLPHDQVK